MPRFTIREQDLINNPTPRVSVCLCLDISPSMSGRLEYGAHPGTRGVPIDELNSGVKSFYQAIKKDSHAKYAAEVGVVAFSHSAFVVRDFDSIINSTPPQLELEMEKGGTSIGSAVKACLELLENCKKTYKKTGVDYYQPWLVIMTDGRPTDNTHLSIAPKVVELVENNKLIIIPIGIGNAADKESLAMLSPKLPPLKLQGLRFKEFFEWLSSSVSAIPHSKLGEEVKIDRNNVKGWSVPL